MASIHGTVSTILAVHSRAPCSPCMNWLNRQFMDSTPTWVHSLSPKFLRGESGWFWTHSNGPAALAPCRGDTICSGSTSIDQSRSVSAFHWACLAFSYSLFRAGRAPFS